jgi:hypothetical protein
MLRRLKKEVLHDLPAKIRQRIVVATDSTVTKSISHTLKRNFGSLNDRKALEEIIIRRTQIFQDTGRIQTGAFMSELPKDMQS